MSNTDVTEFTETRNLLHIHYHLQKPELKKEIDPGLIKDVETARMPSKEDRMKIMESYVGILKLKKPLTLEEIFELEEDNWLY